MKSIVFIPERTGYRLTEAGRLWVGYFVAIAAIAAVALGKGCA